MMKVAQIKNRELALDELQAILEDSRFVFVPKDRFQDIRLLGWFNGERVQLIVEPETYYELYSKYFYEKKRL